MVVVAPHVASELERLPVTIIWRRFEAAVFRRSVIQRERGALPTSTRMSSRSAAKQRVFLNAVDAPAHATAFAGSGFRAGPSGRLTTAARRRLSPGDARGAGTARRADLEAWTSMAASCRRVEAERCCRWRARRDPPGGDRQLTVRPGGGAVPHASAPRLTVQGCTGATRDYGFVSLVGAGPGDPQLPRRLVAPAR